MSIRVLHLGWSRLRASMFSRTPTKQDEWRLKCSSLRAIKKEEKIVGLWRIIFSPIPIIDACDFVKKLLIFEIDELGGIEQQKSWNSHHTRENYYFNAFSHTRTISRDFFSVFFLLLHLFYFYISHYTMLIWGKHRQLNIMRASSTPYF